MRITSIIAMVAALTAACPGSPAADEKSGPRPLAILVPPPAVARPGPPGAKYKSAPHHAIVVAAGEGPFVFGRSVSVKVSYRNRAEVPWVIPTPSNSRGVVLHYRPTGSYGHPAGYYLGPAAASKRSTPSGPAFTYRDPRIKPLSIAPGKTHDFTAAFERDWTGHIVPGVWTVWLDDLSVEIESNRIEIPLSFTVESVAVCLEIAADRKQSRDKRRHHAKWLQEIMPGLELRWWRRSTPPAEQKPLEAEIQRQLEAFRQFWEDEANVQAIELAIARINRESGVSR